MTEPSFMTDEGFLTIKTIHRLRTVLQREGRVYLTELHKRCGLGLSTAQFNGIVKTLADSQWCSLKEGALGATLVILNQQIRDAHVSEVPESQAS